MPHVSDELSRLRVNIVGLSETRRSGNCETSSEGFIYYWFSMSSGHHVKGVTIGVSSRLQPSDVEFTLVDERVMRLNLKHSVGFSLLLQCMLLPRSVKLKRRCSMQNSTLYWTSFPCRDAFIVLGDFNAVTGTERAGYEICVGPHGSGTGNENSSFLLNLAGSGRQRIAASCIRDKRFTAGVGITVPEGYGGRATISLLVLVGGSSKTAGFFGAPSSLRLITSLLLLHSTFMSSPESLQDVIRI